MLANSMKSKICDNFFLIWRLVYLQKAKELVVSLSSLGLAIWNITDGDITTLSSYLKSSNAITGVKHNLKLIE